MRFKRVKTTTSQDSIHAFLTSDVLHKQLQKEFGQDYNDQPVCDKVSARVVQLANSDKVECVPVQFVLTDELQVVSCKGHWVIYYNNKVYDYTSNQYKQDGIKESDRVRIMTPYTIPDHDLMPMDTVKAYKQDNMIIVLEDCYGQRG